MKLWTKTRSGLIRLARMINDQTPTVIRSVSQNSPSSNLLPPRWSNRLRVRRLPVMVTVWCTQRASNCSSVNHLGKALVSGKENLSVHLWRLSHRSKMTTVLRTSNTREKAKTWKLKDSTASESILRRRNSRPSTTTWKGSLCSIRSVSTLMKPKKSRKSGKRCESRLFSSL